MIENAFQSVLAAPGQIAREQRTAFLKTSPGLESDLAASLTNIDHGLQPAK
jgi:hypothetical protein